MVGRLSIVIVCMVDFFRWLGWGRDIEIFNVDGFWRCGEGRYCFSGIIKVFYINLLFRFGGVILGKMFFFRRFWGF